VDPIDELQGRLAARPHVEVDLSQSSAGGEGRVRVEPGIDDHHARQAGDQFTGKAVGNHHDGTTTFQS